MQQLKSIQEWPRQWKIVAIIVGILILVGLGVAAQRFAGSTPGTSVFGIQDVPSLTGSVTYSDVTPEVKEQLAGLIEEQRTKLKDNVGDYESWLTLAIRYKQAGDYAKAKQVWEYLASIHPDDVVARHNLGDLYHHFLNQPAKAERYYKEAADLKPGDSLEYLSLHELYRYSYKTDTTAAEDVLKLAVERVKGTQLIDIHVALAAYYADEGKKQEAIANYRKARDLAREDGNTRLVTQLNAAIRALQ